MDLAGADPVSLLTEVAEWGVGRKGQLYEGVDWGGEEVGSDAGGPVG